MNKIKEKKLNAIKSEIEEITNFIVSNNKNDISNENNLSQLEHNSEDTFTLTEIIGKDKKVSNNNELKDIKNELQSMKSIIISHEELLKEILTKIRQIEFLK